MRPRLGVFLGVSALALALAGRSARADDPDSNLLLGGTALLAVATAVTGAFFVRWSSAPSGGVASVGRRF